MPYAIQFQYQHLAVPAVCLLIAFLSYTPQFFVFTPNSSSSRYSYSYDYDGINSDPRLTTSQKWKFNVLVICIWVTYYRAVTVGPGSVGRGWVDGSDDGGEREMNENGDGDGDGNVVERESTTTMKMKTTRQRYCRKCEFVKPPRAHHCKVCKRCIPKMDHHCPWTANCVSHFTFPHFMRFLFYATTTLIYLEYLLYLQAAVLWTNRHLPSYLGPSAPKLAILMILLLTNTITLFALSIITLRTVYDLGCNTTTIETWEIERHEQLLRRSRAMGGYLDGPDGLRVPIVRQEFPYDIGIWKNICQGMGTGNFIAWFWIFAQTRKDKGLEWETNGFEDESIGWPPPDPDRMPRLQRERVVENEYNGFIHGSHSMTQKEEIEAFRRRQEDDLRRRGIHNNENRGDNHNGRPKLASSNSNSKVMRRKPFADRFTNDTYEPKNSDDVFVDDNDNGGGNMSGEEGWRDQSGSRLMDYGVDEGVEFYDEDEVPLAELLRRRKRNQGVT